MSKLCEMVNRRPHGVFTTNIEPAAAHGIGWPSIKNKRDLGAFQKSLARIINHRTRQDEPISFAIPLERAETVGDVFVGVRGRNSQRVTFGACPGGHTGKKLGKKGTVGVMVGKLQNKAKRPRETRLDRLGMAERLIVHFFSFAFHPQLRCLCAGERSGDLRAVQRRNIADRSDHVDRVEWLDQPPTESWQGILLANEVLDALAVERFRQGAEGPEQMCVEFRDNRLDWAFRPAPPALC